MFHKFNLKIVLFTNNKGLTEVYHCETFPFG